MYLPTGPYPLSLTIFFNLLSASSFSSILILDSSTLLLIQVIFFFNTYIYRQPFRHGLIFFFFLSSLYFITFLFAFIILVCVMDAFQFQHVARFFLTTLLLLKIIPLLLQTQNKFNSIKQFPTINEPINKTVISFFPFAFSLLNSIFKKKNSQTCN